MRRIRLYMYRWLLRRVDSHPSSLQRLSRPGRPDETSPTSVQQRADNKDNVMEQFNPDSGNLAEEQAVAGVTNDFQDLP